MQSLRLLVISINVVTGIAVLFIALAAAFVNSESGARRTVAFALERLPGDIEIGGIEGTLAGGLILHDIVLRSGGDRVTVERALLTWSASSLVAGAAVLNGVAVQGMVWSLGAGPSSDSGARGSGWPAAPFPIVVRNASVERLSLRYADVAHDFKSVTLAGRWVGRSVVVSELRSESAGIAFTGRVEAALTQPVALTLESSWAGDVEGRRAAGTLHIEGTLPTLELRHELILPETSAAIGELRLTSPPAAETELLVETERTSFRAAGDISLVTTQWDLAIGPPGTEAELPFRDRSDEGQVSGRFEGRLFPRLEWRFSVIEEPERRSGSASADETALESGASVRRAVRMR